jgi:5-methylcytosine-specific restriction endonuclease McrA
MRKPSEIERLHGVSNSATLSIKEILYLLSRKCAGCGRGFKSIEDATIDHVIPKSKGGEDNWRNYQLMHKACNEYKADRLPEVYELLEAKS